MPQQYSNNVWKILVCPYCGYALEKADRGASCHHCKAEYGYIDSGVLDLRLQRLKKYHFEFAIGKQLFEEPGFDFRPLSPNLSPEVDFSDVRIPHHLSKNLMSYFPGAKGKESLMLDLGCGRAVNREICEHAGFEYVGFDYDSSHAPMLGDAHSLPFRDNSFEFILSIAVLEHIRFPFVMMREVYRVLKSRGKFIGTAAFLAPFHDNSFYHHTHIGLFNSLQCGGFKIERIAPSENWSVLIAQAQMGLFRRMPKLLSRSLVSPLQLLHELWWRIVPLVKGNIKENNLKRILKFTGAFSFVASKE